MCEQHPQNILSYRLKYDFYFCEREMTISLFCCLLFIIEHVIHLFIYFLIVIVITVIKKITKCIFTLNEKSEMMFSTFDHEIDTFIIRCMYNISEQQWKI